MNDTTPTSPTPTGTLRASSATPAAPIGGVHARDTRTGASGAAFRALIEKLELEASALEQDAASVAGPDDLAGAVDREHAKLQDALTLSERLLEAYRESTQRSALAPEPESK